MKTKPKTKPKSKIITVTKDLVPTKSITNVTKDPRPATIIVNRYMEYAQKTEQRITSLEKQVKALSDYSIALARLTAKLVNDLKKGKSVKLIDLPDIRSLFK